MVTVSVTIRLSASGKRVAFPGWMRLAEAMRIERWEPGDTATAMACYEVFLAAHAAAGPAVRRIATGNAAGNQHMIAVNEALGYEVAEPGYRHYTLDVTAAGEA